MQHVLPRFFPALSPKRNIGKTASILRNKFFKNIFGLLELISAIVQKVPLLFSKDTACKRFSRTFLQA